MKYYMPKGNDPKYNLALEEYLFENCRDDLFMLWQNDKSVIIGRNQNVFCEVDLAYAKAHGISVVRRITGGGAVYHDLGNINFTFVSTSYDPKMDFAYFSQPIVDALSSLGVASSVSGRNDIELCDGRKISGSARREKDGRIMHHGTLLYKTDTETLSKVLCVNPAKIKSKGVKSVKSRVGNIKGELKTELSSREFIEKVANYVIERYGCEEYVLTEKDKAAIEKLVFEKYSRDEWNLASDLPFEAKGEKYFPYGLVTVSYSVKSGRLSDVKLFGDFFGKLDVSLLEKALVGTAYDEESIRLALDDADVGQYISGAQAGDIAKLFFEYS